MPPVSEKQRRAMYAASEGKSTLGIPKSVGKEFVAADANAKIAAGTVFVAPDGDVLLLKRAGEQGKDNFVGHWALPGGGGEDGETPEETADREATEELGGAAPIGKKRLMDRKVTPTGMVFHTFAQPVEDKFTPRLNDEHSEFGWFQLNKLPRPIHPAVNAVLGANLGMAKDMEPEDWQELRDNFAQWTREEEAELEHQSGGAEDDQPGLSTAANAGVPAALAKWNKKAKDEAKRAKDANACPTCGGTGELAGPGSACEDCAGTGLTKRIAQDAVCRACKGRGCDKCGGSGVAPGERLAPKGSLGALDGMLRGLAYDSRKEPEHTLLVRYDGDFSFKGLLAHLERLGAIGASRTIEARDEDDKVVPFGWDGDGADKIWEAEIDGHKMAFDRAMIADMNRYGMAFDREPSLRRVDKDGHMLVESSIISAAAVNDYLGEEIPGWKGLGLNPKQLYALYRTEEDMEKGAQTLHGKPLLIIHRGITAATHPRAITVGSVINPIWECPNLRAELAVWDGEAIKLIESGRKKHLSAGYRYVPVMQAGEYKGKHFVGKMTAIEFNHCALVVEPRVEGAVVGDRALDAWHLIESAILGLGIAA